MDYWFKTDDQVIIIDEKDKTPTLTQAIDQVKSQVISETSHQSDVRELLLETIYKYKNMEQNANNNIEKQVLQTTIETLYKKIDELEKGEEKESDESGKEKNVKPRRTVEQKRWKALREIFEFYAKQQLNAAKSMTFDKLGKQYNSMNLGKFSVMLKHFRIKYDNLVKFFIKRFDLFTIIRKLKRNLEKYLKLLKA